jgi:hypothetical protein
MHNIHVDTQQLSTEQAKVGTTQICEYKLEAPNFQHVEIEIQRHGLHKRTNRNGSRTQTLFRLTLSGTPFCGVQHLIVLEQKHS